MPTVCPPSSKQSFLPLPLPPVFCAVPYCALLQALKAVDPRLLSLWLGWSKGYRPSSECRAIWDSFPPLTCDLHGVWSSSKDTFSKLLKREGTNFKKAFKEALEDKFNRWYRKYEASCMARGEPERGDVVDEQRANGGLSSREFNRLLLDLGIQVLHTQRRLLHRFSSFCCLLLYPSCSTPSCLPH